MNMFVLGWDLPPGRASVIRDALGGLTATYPFLDPSTLTLVVSRDGTTCFASLQVAKETASPRVYVSQSTDEITLFDGCPVGLDGRINTHDAGDLGRHWRDLRSVLEGQFAVARGARDGAWMELMTDPLGVYQVFYLRQGKTWLLSNSVQVLARVGAGTVLDSTAVSMFVGMGFVGGDRTLNEGVRVVPAGAHWRWSRSHGFKDASYYPWSGFADRAQRALSRAQVARLAEDLGGRLRVLGSNLGPLDCPITAGRDSRVMAALLLRYGVQAQYFTAGSVGSADRSIGSQIARHFDLTHRAGEPPSLETVTHRWEDLSQRFLGRTDGMVTLEHIRNAFNFPSELSRLVVHLYGIGGEVARAYYINSTHLLAPPDAKAIRRLLKSVFLGRNQGGNLLTAAGQEVVENHCDRFVDGALATGFKAKDVPDLFYLSERVRRWGGNNFRQATPYSTVYSPFCTRPYVEAAFAIPVGRRFAEHIPFEMLRFLVPEIADIPFDKPWRHQNPHLLKLSVLMGRGGRFLRRRISSARTKRPEKGDWRGQQGVDWLELKKSYYRELCLDQSDPAIWDYVNRKAFTELMAPEADASHRARERSRLFSIMTVCQYNQLLSDAPGVHD
jgi:asparagine synthase (glutamine-hydrolysing)